MTDTLMPCPFCNGKALAGHRDMGGWIVQCTECKASSDVRIAREDAIWEWSKRAIEAENKRLRGALKQITLCQPEAMEPNGADIPDHLDAYIGDLDLMLTSAIEIARDALKGGE